MSRHKVPLLRKYAVLNLRNTRISNSMFQIAKSSYLDYSSAAVKYAVKKDTNILQTYLNDENVHCTDTMWESLFGKLNVKPG